MECKSLRESGDAIRAFNVKYFAVSVDDPDTNKQFAQNVEADYPILSDQSKAIAKAYGVLSDRGVASRWTFYIGKDGKILAIDQQVSPSSAGEDVVANLKRLGVEARP